MKNKQFAVIGIGRFEESLVKELTRLGYENWALKQSSPKLKMPYTERCWKKSGSIM